MQGNLQVRFGERGRGIHNEESLYRRSRLYSTRWRTHKQRTTRVGVGFLLKRFTAWCKENRHRRLPVLGQRLNATLRGYDNDYGPGICLIGAKEGEHP